MSMRNVKKLHGVLARQSRGRIYTIALGLEGLIGWLDYVTGPFVSFSAYYLLPIALVAWYGSNLTAYSLALLSGVLRATVISQLPQQHAFPLMAYNTLLLGMLFLFVAALVCRLRQTMHRLDELSARDDLTKVSNRRQFLEVCAIEIENAQRQKAPLTLAFLDLDNFKALNDTLGHQRGDELLVATADSIRQALRTGDHVGRLGGDEFAILLPRTDRDQAEQVLARIHEKIGAAFAPFQSAPPGVSASIGAVVYAGTQRLNTGELLAKADAQMYAVKAAAKSGSRIAAA